MGHTMRFVVPIAMLLVASAVLCGLVYSLTILARWYTWRRDDDIDHLIRAAGAKYRTGCEQPDRQKLDRAGDKRWRETVQGQRRLLQKKPKHEQPKHVVLVKKAANR